MGFGASEEVDSLHPWKNRMLTYKAAYWFEESGWVVAQVVEFPGAVTQGKDLDDARRMLQSALVDMAETHLLNSEPLPLPDPAAEVSDDNEPDLEEPIHLLLQSAVHVRVVPINAA